MQVLCVVVVTAGEREKEREIERAREREIVCSAIRQSGFVFVHLTSPICGIPKRNSTPVEEKPAFDSFPS